MAIINSFPMYHSEIPSGGSPFVLAKYTDASVGFGFSYRANYDSDKGNIIYRETEGWGPSWMGNAIIPLVSFTADVNDSSGNPVNLSFEAGKKYDFKLRYEPNQYHYFQIINTTDNVTVCSYQSGSGNKWNYSNFMYHITII